MKRYLKHQAKLVIMLVMVQAFLAACTREEGLAPASGDELQVNVTTAGYASITSGTPETRATDDGYATSFADGDEIGVIAVQGGAVVVDNIPYAYGGGAWAPSTAEKAYIPFGTGVTWLVYYPYSTSMNGKTTEAEILDAFTVPDDQGTPEKYTAADLMMWSGAITGNALTATLAHGLAMVEVNLPAGAGNAKLKVNGGAERTPWNISGTTYRCLVKPATGATLGGTYAQAGGILAWQQANVTLEAGKYARVNVATASYITGYAGEIVIEYKGGESENIAASGIKDHASAEIVRSITLTGKGKTHLIGRVINADNPIHLKFDDSGDLQLRDSDADGFIPIGSYAEFQKIISSAPGNYRQETDLDLMDEEWTPVENDGNYFIGEFDGAGKKISNLKISLSGQYLQSLFRGNQGIIRDVHIASGTITSYSSGGICVRNEGQLVSCSNAATVKGSQYVGGVTGSNTGTVTGCYNTGAVEGSQYVGGVTGSNSGVVTACYNTGAVSGTSFVGGVAGTNEGANSKLTACYNTGAVTGNSLYIGGVAGSNDGAVIACYNTGAVTGDYCVGGVTGINIGTVTACYNTGAVKGTGDYVGGVTGVNTGTITACYNTGAVTGDNALSSGSVVGMNDNGTVTACYWESTTATNGIGTGTVDGVNPFTLPVYFTPTGSAAWNTGTDGEDGYWKAGTTNGTQLPQLWWEI